MKQTPQAKIQRWITCYVSVSRHLYGPRTGNRMPEQGSPATGEQHSLVSLAVQDGLPPLKAGQTPLPPALGCEVRWCRVQILAGWFRGDALGWWAKVGDRHFSELRLKQQVSVDQALTNRITHVMASP